MAYTLSESPWLLEKQVAGTRYLEGPELNYEIPTELTLFADLAAITRSYFNDVGFKVIPPKRF